MPNNNARLISKVSDKSRSMACLTLSPLDLKWLKALFMAFLISKSTVIELTLSP